MYRRIIARYSQIPSDEFNTKRFRKTNLIALHNPDCLYHGSPSIKSGGCYAMIFHSIPKPRDRAYIGCILSNIKMYYTLAWNCVTYWHHQIVRYDVYRLMNVDLIISVHHTIRAMTVASHDAMAQWDLKNMANILQTFSSTFSLEKKFPPK